MRILTFDLINGLPLHPLVIHLAVIFVPLFSVLFILINFKSNLREKYGNVTLIGLGIAFIASIVSKKSGEALSARVGLPVEHSNYGDKLVLTVGLLFVIALIWQLNLRKPAADRKLSDQTLNIIGKIGVLVAVIAIVFGYLTGNSGARATWEKRIAQESVATPNADATAASEVDSEVGDITLAEVAQHNSIDDCWVAVSGKVYDVTKFVSQHPGGSDKIERICGTDGTAAFKGQHRGEDIPENTLSNYEIGTLAQ